jgi:cell division protein FtsB
MKEDDAATTILDQIAGVLEEHNRVLVKHKKHLEQLSREVAELNSRVQDLEAAGSLDSSDAKFLAGVTSRLKAISTALDKEL